MSLNSYGNAGVDPAAYLAGASFSPSRDTDREPDYGAPRDRPDESMEQIRDLIMGDLRRSWDARLSTLETRLQTLEEKLEAVRHEARAERDGHLAALAEGIDDLGQHVRRLARP